MDTVYTTRTDCRICHSPFKTVIDLGDIYLNNFVEDEKGEYPFAPLTLVVCTNPECELVQLQHTADLDKLYRQYWYQSALNKGMVSSLQEVVDDVMDYIPLLPGDIIVDIGCNDGTMLSQFPSNLYKVGFDPALNLREKAEKNCNEFHNTYFDAKLYLQDDDAWKATVITSIAMFYDLEDPNKFVKDIKKCLANTGMWVIQLTDLVSMMKANAFDAICHEHLEYYSLKTICYLMKQHDLEVFNVSTNNVNGGSIRVFVAFEGEREIRDSVAQHLQEEKKYLESFEDPFAHFASRIKLARLDLLSLLVVTKETKSKVYALGASTKGNTLLQYYGINNEYIPYAAEVNADKFGRRTVGTNIEIISEREAISHQPDYFLVLPWHFKDGIIKKVREAGYKGKFILPLPEVTIV